MQMLMQFQRIYWMHEMIVSAIEARDKQNCSLFEKE